MEERTTPIVARHEYSMVFSVQRQSGALVKMSMKFWGRKGCGQRFADNAWSVVINDVSAMNTNGARNAIAATISRLLSATEIRKRFRRTARGGRRRTSGEAADGAVTVSAAPPGAPTCAS